MFLVKFKSCDSDRVNYVYMNNKKQLVGFSLDCDGVKSFQNDLFDKIIDAMHVNDRCVELLDIDADGYDVYYDPETKFKHYLKNGKEDFKMFFFNNGVNAVEYRFDYIEEDESDEEERDFSSLDSFSKKFFTLGIVAIFGFSAMTALLSSKNEILNSLDFYAYNDSETTTVITSFDGEMLTVDDALALINESSYLSNSDKDFLTNKELFSDIMPYYEGTSMQNDIKIRLNNIKVKYFDESNYYYHPGLTGYYDALKPSVIHIFDEYKDSGHERNAILGHEFIHLLQNSYSKYSYLIESTAELLSEEYFDVDIETSYEEGVKSLKLLVEIIGTEPILKGVFGGDFSDLESILSSNLETDDYQKLVDYMTKSPKDTFNDEKDIRKILCNLYQNIYGQDISQDENILYEALYISRLTTIEVEGTDRRYYFNKSKMEDMETVVIDAERLCWAMPTNSIVTSKAKYLVSKELTKEEHEQYMNDENARLSYKSSLVNGCMNNAGNYIIYDSVSYIDGGILYGNPVQTMSVGEAIENDYLNVYVYGELTANKNIALDEQLPEGWRFEIDYDTGENITTDYFYETGLENASINDDLLVVTRRGIKDRFDVDSNSNINTNSNKITR